MTYKNTNKVLDNTFIGLKTGTTPSAGPCIALDLSFGTKDSEIIIILLNCVNTKERWADCLKLREFVGILNGHGKYRT